MALYINTNAASIGAQRNLGTSQKNLIGNVGRLSSGQRINQAADDAAGLGISEKLKAQIRGLSQAQRNANDGISMIQVAEGAMNEQSSILTRLRELAVQASNSTLGTDELGFIQTEADELVGELDRISEVTEFNGVFMLGANAGEISMQVGIHGSEENQLNVTFNATGEGDLALDTLDWTSSDAARDNLEVLDEAINTLSTNRSLIGAAQNRLGVTLNNLSVAHENLSAANSRIRDVDVADETAALTKNQILSQAGIAVLAQANQLPSAALSLLG